MMERRKTIFIFGLILIIAIAIIGIITANKNKQVEEVYNSPSPEEVVRQYFTAWNNKNYPDMYATISDGFKRIDQNANDLTSFRNFASSQAIEGVKIISIKEESNNSTID